MTMHGQEVQCGDVKTCVSRRFEIDDFPESPYKSGQSAWRVADGSEVKIKHVYADDTLDVEDLDTGALCCNCPIDYFSLEPTAHDAYGKRIHVGDEVWRVWRPCDLEHRWKVAEIGYDGKVRCENYEHGSILGPIAGRNLSHDLPVFDKDGNPIRVEDVLYMDRGEDPWRVIDVEPSKEFPVRAVHIRSGIEDWHKGDRFRHEEYCSLADIASLLDGSASEVAQLSAFGDSAELNSNEYRSAIEKIARIGKLAERWGRVNLNDTEARK